MRDYRVRIRAERMTFFEELMSSLDFCDYAKEDTDVELMPRQLLDAPLKKEKATSIIKSQERRKIDASALFQENLDNLREAMLKIDARRDQNRRREG